MRPKTTFPLVTLSLLTGCLLGYQSLLAGDVRITGPTLERFGYVTRIVGDVNNDGVDDFAVTSPIAGVDKVYVYFGPTSAGTLTQADADLVFTGASNSETGWALAGPGDVNGDGAGDLVIGAPSASSGKGQVYVLYGPLSAGTLTSTSANVRLTGSETNGIFGVSVDVGDYTGDGVDDLLVGAPWQTVSGGAHTGRALLYTGPVVQPTRTSPPSPTHTFEGGQTGANTGLAVAFAGNMDNTGGEEIVIGAPRYNGTLGAEGSAYLVWSGLASGTHNLETSTGDIARIRGDRQAGELGHAIAGGEDVDGDGYDDIVVAAPSPYCAEFPTSCASDHGTVHLYTGGPQVAGDPPLLGELDATADSPNTITGTTAYSGFGVSLAMLGDINGGGCADVLVGSLYNKAYLYYGGDPASHTLYDTNANAIFSGASASDWGGVGVGGGGDVNDDGLPDLLIGAPGQRFYNDGPQAVTGKVYAFFGEP